MRVIHPNLKIPLVKEGTFFNISVIENVHLFAEIAMDLWCQINGHSGTLVFSIDGNTCNPRSCVLLSSPFEADLNNRTILNKTYKCVEDSVMKDVVPEDYFTSLRSLYDAIDPLVTDFGLEPTGIDDIPISKSLALFGMKYHLNEKNIGEQIIDFVTIHRNLFDTKLFILLQICSYLSLDELCALREHSEYEKIQIWLLEVHDNMEAVRHDDTNYVIIDIDLCEI